MAAAFVVSPRRRRAVGNLRFLAGRALIAGVPLAGVVVVRAALLQGYRAEGRDPFTAGVLSVLFSVVFIVAAASP